MKTIKHLYSKEKKIFGELKYTQDVFSDYRKHFHNHFGLALIDKGQIEINYHHRDTVTLNNQSIVIFNPGQVHQSQIKNAQGYYVLFLDNQWCTTIKKEFFFEKNIIEEKAIYLQLKHVFEDILNNTLSTPEVPLKEVMHSLFENHASQNKQKEKEMILTIKSWIDKQDETALNVENLARYVGYNKSYLIRFFKKEVGLTPQQYILNTKVNRAKELLLNSSQQQTLADISIDSGFFDQSHLNRNFKNQFGTSPKTYKKVNIIQDK